MAESRNDGSHRIVIVGGGAGGLELASRLGRKGRVEVTLIDRDRTHTWKPRLHAVAAGSMSVHDERIDYLYQAHQRGFEYCRGAMSGLDREARQVIVSEVRGNDGELVLPERRIPYDTLVIAVGSVSNDFDIPGVGRYMYALDTAAEADLFHQRLINACYWANGSADEGPGQLSIAIVGAGATGVELAAELHHAIGALAAYGLDRLDPERNVRIRLIEAGSRVLPGLGEDLARAVHERLEGMKVEVLTEEKVSEVTETEIRTESGRVLPADIAVWAAGIRAPSFLAELDGLEVDEANRLRVTNELVTTRDLDIYVIGDCAATPAAGGGILPPLAQVAHQQASHLARVLPTRSRGEGTAPFCFRNRGALVSLGDEDTVGRLMGFLQGRGFRVEGWLAGAMYRMLYHSHRMTVQGVGATVLETVASAVRRPAHPSVKLH
ncbi:MAG: NAD(P)/FAD-dependent oxidoreductase [Azoarcus sp.]|nr:NAD(P)/FAD-dependent oxidoreductase [Azoarcus sp.]